jgi:acyl-homoserine lactone acylase PvdQ
MRRAVAVPFAFVAALVLALAVPAGAATPTLAPSYGTVLNILPPGAQGRMNAVEAATFEATGARPAHFDDQLEMYDALNKRVPGSLTEADLATYYKSAALGVAPADIVSTYSPRAGVTIVRDRFGVPHVFGDTYEDTEYGAGYAGTEDRMFLQDTLRHVGAARAAEFLGPSDANIAMDAAQLQDADYTPAEAEAQVANLPKRFGAEGERFVRGIDAFLAGINAAQHAALTDPTKLPAEYPALQIVPKDWTRADLIYVASLVGGRFGLGGGGEYANGLWLQRLIKKFGAVEGRKVFDDLRERDDPEAPVTIPTPFSYLSQAGVDPAAVALPDLDAPTAPGAGSPAAAPTAVPAAVPMLDGPFGKIPLDLRPHGMSNALLVSAKESATGHPITVFGPQTGYFTPQLLTEVDLHGPGIEARGVSFAGTQLIVELGRGRDYAWSATSASGDNTDQVFEVLCNTDGSPATVQSTAYLVGTTCTPMETRQHQEIAKPTAGGTGAPQVVTLNVMRTRHGIVQLRTTAGGKPVAVVDHRVTYGHELDSGIGFMRVNDPTYVHGADDFMHAFDGVDYTFNWFYADDRDIAYFESGLLPQRDPRVDPDLPSWGSGEYEWRGWLPFAAHPHAVNPPAGYLANWNNKPAPGFAAADNEWGYGPVYRSQQLSRRIAAGIAGPKKMTRAGLVAAMMDAATADVRGTDVIPYALDVVGDDPSVAPAVALLRSWIAGGAHRVDHDRDGAYDEQAAVALADAWYPSLAKDALRGTLGDLVDALPHAVDDHPSLGLGSSWNGVPWYGYLNKDLRAVRGAAVAGPYSRVYCGGGTLAQCRADLVASLKAAVAALTAAQGADPAKWTYDKHVDDIRATTVGIVGNRNIDWQNRPTFQQVVAFTSHEKKGASTGAGGGLPVGVPAQPEVLGVHLAATGLPGPVAGALPLAALLALTAAAVAHRAARRPRAPAG